MGRSFLDFFFAQLQYGLLTFLTQLTQRSQEAFTWLRLTYLTCLTWFFLIYLTWLLTWLSEVRSFLLDSDWLKFYWLTWLDFGLGLIDSNPRIKSVEFNHVWLTSTMCLTWLKCDLHDLTVKSGKSDLSQVSQVWCESKRLDLPDLKFVWNTTCWLSWLCWLDWVRLCKKKSRGSFFTP